MNQDHDNLLLAVGCVFLVAWYGVARLTANGRQRNEALERQRINFANNAREALEAEFRESLVESPHIPGGSVVCEECGIEYPAGTLYCSCGAETVEAEELDEFTVHALAEAEDSEEAEEERGSAQNNQMVCIEVVENYWKASLLKSLLETNGIPCVIGGNSSSGPYQFNFGPLTEMRIYVLPLHVKRAQALIHTPSDQEMGNTREE